MKPLCKPHNCVFRTTLEPWLKICAQWNMFKALKQVSLIIIRHLNVSLLLSPQLILFVLNSHCMRAIYIYLKLINCYRSYLHTLHLLCRFARFCLNNGTCVSCWCRMSCWCSMDRLERGCINSTNSCRLSSTSVSVLSRSNMGTSALNDWKKYSNIYWLFLYAIYLSCTFTELLYVKQSLSWHL